MLYVLSLLFIIVKGLAFVLLNHLVIHLNIKSVSVAVLLVIAIILLKKKLTYQKRYPDEVEHIMQYRFNNKIFFKAVVASLVLSAISYILLVAYLRVKAFGKPLDLNVVLANLQEIYLQWPTGVLLYNLFLFGLVLYVFLLVIKNIRKTLNIYVTMVHFYWLTFDKYKKWHNKIHWHYSLDAFIGAISFNWSKLVELITTLVCFGYYKEAIYIYYDDENLPAKTKRYIWTKEDQLKYKPFEAKSLAFLGIFDKPLEFIFYKLHIILLLIIVAYDLILNNYVLTHVAVILPFLFVYQIYVFLCTFLRDKPTHHIAQEISIMYYADVKYLNERYMMIDGEVCRRPEPGEFPKAFFAYERSNFSWTRMMQEKPNTY